MKTVGTVLKDARIARGLKPSDIERAIKIREKYILAIEADAFGKLPSPSYAKGFVRNYAEYLGLSQSQMMAFFRRQMTESPKSSLLPKGVSDPLNKPLVHLTPGRFLGFVISILVILFLAYLGNQYFRIGKAPTLTVTSPLQNAVVSERRIVVEGKTDPDATVTINGVSTIVRDDGRFYEQLPVENGTNTITIQSVSRFGKETKDIRTITFNE
jgi:cytoskeletal protein RodZ